MSTRITRIIGYGIYMPYEEFKSKFASEDEFETFCENHGKLKIGVCCFIGDYMSGEWAFYGRILVATESDWEELPNVDLTGLASQSYEVNRGCLPSGFGFYSSKLMYLTQYA